MLRKILDDDLSQAEETQLSDWLREDHRNRLIFQDLKATFSCNQEGITQAKNRVWQLLDHKLVLQQDRPSGWISAFKKYGLQVAALVLVGLSVIFLQQSSTEPGVGVESSIPMIEKACPMGQKLTVKLSDGSVVKLNAGSRLLTPEVFEHERRVILEGEAFFDVTKSELPFIVEARDLEVTVLGTSFNIRAYKEAKKTIVAVASGLVKVSPLDESKSLTREVQPGQMLKYGGGQSYMTVSGFDQEAMLAWKDNKLVFKDRSLYGILNELHKWYDVNFIINDGPSYRKNFSGKFNNPTLEEVMKSLSFAYDFKYEINETQIVITKPN
ncbi:MAG: FecR domain-containing protein [Bacteroidota bacterium]